MTRRRENTPISRDIRSRAGDEPGHASSKGSQQEPASPPGPAEATRVAAADFLDADTANAFLRLATEGFMVVDHDGSIRYANRRIHTLFAQGPEALQGLSVEELLPGVLARLLGRGEDREAATSRGATETQEVTARRGDGTTFPAQLRIGAPSIAGGPGTLCIVEDRSELRFEPLFRVSPTPTYVWQHRQDDFYLVDFNDAGSDAEGWFGKHVLGKGLREVYPEDCVVIDHIRQCFAERTQLVREIPDFRINAADAAKDLLIRYVFVLPDLVLAFTEDLTAKRSFQRDLRTLSSAVEQTADTVFITDRSGRIEYVNPAFERTSGFSREEALGNTPRILKSGVQEGEYYERLWGTILGGESFHATVINRKKNGELYHAEQTITPMKDAEGRITHFVSVLRDMTETIRLREQETESNLARKVQRRLFPSEAPHLVGFDLAGGVFPAAATCGDYFDFIPMAAGKLGVVVADACGHGMGPALIMAETRAYLRAAAPTESDPHHVLQRIHRRLLADLDERDYVTMILACLDPATHFLHYASAGHVPAFVLDHTGRLRRELHSTGRPLGAVPDLAMTRTESLPLVTGDIVVLLTDGILEATDANESEFGQDRALEVVARHRHAPAREIVDRLHDEVLTFATKASLSDDLTAVVCKVI